MTDRDWRRAVENAIALANELSSALVVLQLERSNREQAVRNAKALRSAGSCEEWPHTPDEGDVDYVGNALRLALAELTERER